jgi:hypothetical protein
MRRRRRGDEAIPPSLLRFDLADWSEPDDLEARMGDVPDHVREWHAYRRYTAALNAFFRDHPAAMDTWWEAFLARTYPGRVRGPVQGW